jgi:hypothetical protein
MLKIELPISLTSLGNEKAQFKESLRLCIIHNSFGQIFVSE